MLGVAISRACPGVTLYAHAAAVSGGWIVLRDGDTYVAATEIQREALVSSTSLAYGGIIVIIAHGAV